MRRTVFIGLLLVPLALAACGHRGPLSPPVEAFDTSVPMTPAAQIDFSGQTTKGQA